MSITLANLRALLNDELGLSSDSDNTPFGTAAVRNQALATALKNLWPQCAKLITEEPTTDVGTLDYDLDDVWDILAIEVLYENASVEGPKQPITKFRSYRNEADVSHASHLTLFTNLRSNQTLRIIGWAPYAVVDTSSEASTTDVPSLMYPVVTAGARSILYLRKLNQYANFERLQNTNRSTSLSVEQVLALWQSAEREYREGMRMWQRGAAEPRTANFR